MLSRLLLLFIVVPALELILLIQMGQWIGTLPTVDLIVVTGIIGAYLAVKKMLNPAWLLHRLASLIRARFKRGGALGAAGRGRSFGCGECGPGGLRGAGRGPL